MKSQNFLNAAATEVVGKIVRSPKHGDVIADIFATEYTRGQLTELCASQQESLNSEHHFQRSLKSSEAFQDRVLFKLLFMRALSYARA